MQQHIQTYLSQQQRKPKPRQQQRQSPSLFFGCACVVLMAALAVLFVPTHRIDTLNQQQIEQRVLSFQKRQGYVALPRAAVSDAGVHDAVSLMPEPLRSALFSDFGRTYSVWLTLWDDQDEDGDVVQIQSGAFRSVVPIQHEPRSLLVPVMAAGVSGSGWIEITGVRDGGGGITVACMDETGSPLPLPVISKGQTLPVRVK